MSADTPVITLDRVSHWYAGGPALEEHRMVIGAAADLSVLDGLDVIELRREEREFTALVRGATAHDVIASHRPTLDEVLLGYLRAREPLKETA